MLLRILSLVVSLARLRAALGAGILLAVDRLFIQKALVDGSPFVALALVIPLVALPLYALATPVGLALGLIRRDDDGLPPVVEWIGVTLAAIAVAFLSREGTGPRVWLVISMALGALVLEASGSRITLGRRLGPLTRVGVAAGVLVAVFLVPVLLLRPSGSFHRLDLESRLPEPTGPSEVVLLGVDGLDWPLTRRLMEEGRLPNLSALADEGLALPLRTLRPTSSPFLWNAIYSGFTPGLHRLRAAAYTPHFKVRIRDRDRIATPDALDFLLAELGAPMARQPHAVWELLDAVGYDVSVIGAWEHLPVASVGRLMSHVSLHYAPEHDPDRWIALKEGPRLRGDPLLLERMTPLPMAPAKIPDAEWRALVGDTLDLERLRKARYVGDEVPAVEQRMVRLRSVYASDRLRVAMAKTVLETAGPRRFLYAYVRGVDVAQHAYWHLHENRGDPGEEALDDVVARYYEVADRWIGEIRDAMSDDGVLIVVSDHGINPDETQEHPYKTGFHDHAPDGVLFSSHRADDVDPGPMDAHILDVAPTILSLLGLPIHAGMEGRVIEAITPRTFSVESWWSLRPALYERGNPELSNPGLEKFLKSLGYL